MAARASFENNTVLLERTSYSPSQCTQLNSPKRLTERALDRMRRAIIRLCSVFAIGSVLFPVWVGVGMYWLLADKVPVGDGGHTSCFNPVTPGTRVLPGYPFACGLQRILPRETEGERAGLEVRPRSSEKGLTYATPQSVALMGHIFCKFSHLCASASSSSELT